MKALIFTITLLALFSERVFAQDYAIKLHRREKPGNTYNLTVFAMLSTKTVVTLNGAIKKGDQDETQVQFQGVEKILEVTPAGDEKKATLTVGKFTIMAKGSISEAFPPGTVITASVVNKKQVYQVNGKPVDAGIATALEFVASMDVDAGGSNEDDIFGTSDRKRKGDSWDASADKLAKYFAKSTRRMQVTNPSAKTMLEDVTGDSMTISEHLIGNVVFPGAPPNAVVDKNAVDNTHSITLPIDATKSAPASEKESMSMNYAAHAESPAGDQVVIAVSITESARRAITPK